MSCSLPSHFFIFSVHNFLSLEINNFLKKITRNQLTAQPQRDKHASSIQKSRIISSHCISQLAIRATNVSKLVHRLNQFIKKISFLHFRTKSFQFFEARRSNDEPLSNYFIKRINLPKSLIFLSKLLR